MLYLLVCGSRAWTDRERLESVLDFQVSSCVQEVRVVHGAARGADSLGGAWAEDRGLRVKAMPADWDAHGRRAGYVRNQAMLDLLLVKREEGHHLLVCAFASPSLELSRGTAMMVQLARQADVLVHVEEG